jgi:hypothetical protein
MQCLINFTDEQLTQGGEVDKGFGIDIMYPNTKGQELYIELMLKSLL